MPGTHAVLSASSSHRWLNCPPSARLSEKLSERFGDKGSSYAEEGTHAHSLAEIKLRLANGEINEFTYKAERKTIPGVNADMDKYTDVYVDIVLEKLFSARKTCPDATLLVEQRLDFSKWVPSGFGTGDAVIVTSHAIEVCDLKYGQGVPVSAVDNPQARLYGLGAYSLFEGLYELEWLRTTIIQPRLDSVTSETLSVDELLKWGDEIAEPAKLAWRGEGEFQTGDWCRFCAAKAICAKRASEALTIVQHGFVTPDVIRDEDIPGILKVLDVAEAWCKDIRAYALSQALRGQQFPGWKLVRGRRGRRTFTDEEKVREQLQRAGYTADSYERRELKSSSDLEKLLGKRAFDALLKDYVVQAPGSLALAPESDSRPAYASADADFSDMITTNEGDA